MVASTIDFDEFAMETLSDVGVETLVPTAAAEPNDDMMLLDAYSCAVAGRGGAGGAFGGPH